MFDSFLRVGRTASIGAPDWIANLEGMVRVPILDPSNPGKAYVVVYYEKRRSYAVICFSPDTGKESWRSEVTNGGYGAPAVSGDTLFVLSGFSNLLGIDTNSGVAKWEFKTHARARSAICIGGTNAFFSAGGTLFEIDPDGLEVFRWQLPGAFFFGKIELQGQLLLSLAVSDEHSGESELMVVAFYRDGGLAYSKRIGPGFVVSSDTSGLCVVGDSVYLGARNEVVCLGVSDGGVRWRSGVDGFAGRQMCTYASDTVFYTTQNGRVGAVSAMDGKPVWEIRARDPWVVSPVSVAGDTVFALFDAHLVALEARSGNVLQRTPIGHTPYSMATLLEDRILVGGGEPPHYGILVSYPLVQGDEPLATVHAQCVNAWIGEESLQIIVEYEGWKDSLVGGCAFVGAFSSDEVVEATRIGPNRLRFECSMLRTCAPSDYAVLVRLDGADGSTAYGIAVVPISRLEVVPSRVHLSGIPDFVQEKEDYSGAAVLQAAQQIWGSDRNSQEAIRAMCDFALEKSGYEPFQIWRIILRRMMATSARSVSDLPESSESSPTPAP